MDRDNDKTVTFTPEIEGELENRYILQAVYDALSEKGYNPLNQMVGYILTEDPTYITNHRNARAIMSRIDRDELMAALIREYLDL